MKGDFSRLSFNRLRNYSRVLMQQGRVQLDSDWNEQAELNAHRLESSLNDLVGPHGAPSGGQDFALTVREALVCDGLGGHGRVEHSGVFNFHGHEPFTFALWIMPKGGGPLLSRAGESGELAYLLAIDAHGLVSFHRHEREARRDSRVIRGRQHFQAAAPHRGQPAPGEAPHGVVRTLTADRRIPDDRFSHVAITFDGQLSRIYLDGELAAESHDWAPSSLGHGHLLIGAAAGPPPEAYAGEMADIRVWPAALTGGQVRELSNGGPTPRASEALAHWTFERTADDLVRDRSGNDHALVLAALAGGAVPRRSSSVWIERGRYYIDGVVCENAQPVLFTNQPDYPGAALPPDSGETTLYLAYLESWERCVSAIEDPALPDPALGGIDTTVRARTVWQVKLLPVSLTDEIPESAEELPEWLALRRSQTAKGRLVARNIPAGTTLQNQLYRVEIHTASPTPAMHATLVEAQVLSERLLNVHAWAPDGIPWTVGEVVELLTDHPPQAQPASTAALITNVDKPQGIIEVDQLAPHLRAAHRLHLRRAATFKWSRENGSVAFAVDTIDQVSGTVKLTRGLRDAYSLRIGDWVEVGDDSAALLGTAPQLTRVADVDPTEGKVSLDPAPKNAAGGAHPFLRRWDQSAATAPNLKRGVVPLLIGQWIDLESGIQVRFDGAGNYLPGDYWLIPARMIPAAVDWPQGSAGPEPQAPHGITRRFAPLAILAFEPLGPRLLKSYRETFARLTSLSENEANFLRRTGDLMTGPLLIDNALAVTRTLAVEGEARVGLLRGELEPGIVGEAQLRDGSITPEKLAFAFERDQPGNCVLDDRPTPPPGYLYSGSSVMVFFPPSPEVRDGEVPVGRGRLTAVAIHHHIFVLYDSGSFWRYDLAVGRWYPLSPLDPARGDFAMAALGGRVYVFGGYATGYGILRGNSEYDPTTDRWVERAATPTPRRGMAAAATGSRIHLFGGDRSWLFGRRATAAHEAYVPHTDSWEELPSMGVRRAGAAAVNAHGILHVVGGERRGLFGREATRAHEAFDTQAGRWMRRASLPRPRTRLGAGVLDGKVYALGGERPVPLSRAPIRLRDSDQYSTAFDTWTPGQPMPTALAGFSVVTVANQLYAVCAVTREETSSARILPIAAAYYIHRKITD